MLHSMTGFGSAARESGGWAAASEIRAVNNKGLKVTLRLSPSDPAMEQRLEKHIRSRLRRGSVQLSASLEPVGSSRAATIDEDVLLAYLQSVRSACRKASVAEPDSFAGLLTLPGVIGVPTEMTPDEAAADLLLATLDSAIDSLIDFRAREGQAMREDLSTLAASVRTRLTDVQAAAPAVVAAYRTRLLDRVSELLNDSDAEIPHEAIIREVSVFSERSDINEEVIRLQSHLDQFDAMISADDVEGRKLDFLCQEMFREINTIGSKANDLTIARHVVDMKATAEKIREMVQNVE